MRSPSGMHGLARDAFVRSGWETGPARCRSAPSNLSYETENGRECSRSNHGSPDETLGACGLSSLRLLLRPVFLGPGRGRDATFHRAEFCAAEGVDDSLRVCPNASPQVACCD